MGYIGSSGNYNPKHAWSVGSKKSGASHTKWSFQNFAKFDDDGDYDPNAEQRQYYFNWDEGEPPYHKVTPCSSHYAASRNTSNIGVKVWPPEPCP